MENVVCKFGGTSMADAAAMKRAQAIVEADRNRRYVVVSAPGRRCGGDRKVTDLLYAAASAAACGNSGAFRAAYRRVRERFLGILYQLDLPVRFREEFKRELSVIERRIFRTCMRNGAASYAASRGEYLTAKIFAFLLGVPFVDAEKLIVFTNDGQLSECTYERVARTLSKVDRAVIPGFYGVGACGEIRTFSRGGGDVTGAVIARGVRASLYENWTDVSGVFANDPRTHKNQTPVPHLTYVEFEKRFGGACVLHCEAAEIARRAEIPIRIANTFRPQDEGTIIGGKNATKNISH